MSGIVTTWPMVDPDDVDQWPWSTDVDRNQLAADGVSYLLLETMDGRAVAWAPLGSRKPFPKGEGTHWQIRVVNA